MLLYWNIKVIQNSEKDNFKKMQFLEDNLFVNASDLSWFLRQ